ncbi:non-specific lipid-transfer protein-like protein At5g64080 isoform X2 [Arachis ipaensis]|uniref:non-specific lipid-transfer protein-like protein At5g64080 isoform X2 n=1 Tax=Arachis ipaensis TaxID=130454 RepID=UPI0007AF5CB0|nr:non-specific lipid-transfer protein-like protein At5g64080 isoform X2 [Arachis ipaensis]
MERLGPLCRIVAVLAVAVAMVVPAYAQISTPCNTSTISTSFTPCVGYLTGSSSNSTSPTAACCNSVKSLTSGGMDCLCLIVTGSVPFRIPFNRTLAISLPRACNLPGVPVQCKSTGSPLPAPGPAALGPSLSPASAPSGLIPSPSPQVTPSLAPESDTIPPSVDSGAPSATSGRAGLTPSSAVSSYSLLPSAVLVALGYGVLKHY